MQALSLSPKIMAGLANKLVDARGQELDQVLSCLREWIHLGCLHQADVDFTVAWHIIAFPFGCLKGSTCKKNHILFFPCLAGGTNGGTGNTVSGLWLKQSIVRLHVCVASTMFSAMISCEL